MDCFVAFFVLSHLLLHSSAEDDKRSLPICPPYFQCKSHLGNLPLTRNTDRPPLLSFPFTNNSYPACGLEINCDEEVATVKIGTERSYNVSDINTDDNNPYLVCHDPEFEHHLAAEDCDATFKSLALYSNLNTISFISLDKFNTRNFFKCNDSLAQNSQRTEAFFLARRYKSYKNCQDKGYSVYYMYPEGDTLSPPDVPSQCSSILLPVSSPGSRPLVDADNPFDVLSANITLTLTVSADCLQCRSNGSQCLNVDQGRYNCAIINGAERRRNTVIIVVGISVPVGLVIAIVLFCYFKKKCPSLKSVIFWRKERENHKKIEAFLKSYGSLAPKRYTYSEVKRMTKSFKHKLGKGGYGSVYRGELQNGLLVAVKVLNESKGNGEEFTNELASISKTSHVNIVTFMGFCFEGHKRALIYEFMLNGSLEKFIYEKSSTGGRQLEWETLYQIAVGIARGLHYLHRGCSTRIFHFDIKPHNILLDENFCPKISDFGLSKLCPERESIISMLGARGTAGYIAPEIFSRNFGGVSHKSDVYSYGMMVLEMVGGRENIHAGVDRTSEIYFPHWIYKRLELDEDLGLCGIMNEEENEWARKMIIVGLWCTQTDPSTRPSMSKVMEMLEGPLGSLHVPPRPFLCSPPRQPADSSNTQIF